MGTASGRRLIEILLVEDNPDDTDLTFEALKEGKARNHISVVEDGVDALRFLRRVPTWCCST
jgi:chemotaxis family two-component system response regulator Rcp1